MTDEIRLNGPQVLYRRWEDSQWSPFEIDLAADRSHWREMDSEGRTVVLFVLSSLMVAEERIATKFSRLVGAYGSEEEATFLATQQVDEARHIGYGVWFRREAVSADPSLGEAVWSMLRELLPSVAQSLAPPDTGSDTNFDALGADAEDIRKFALSGLRRRLNLIGVPLETL